MYVVRYHFPLDDAAELSSSCLQKKNITGGAWLSRMIDAIKPPGAAFAEHAANLLPNEPPPAQHSVRLKAPQFGQGSGTLAQNRSILE
jgi:hypothetical protein